MNGVFPGGEPGIGTPGSEADRGQNKQQNQDAEFSKHDGRIRSAETGSAKLTLISVNERFAGH